MVIKKIRSATQSYGRGIDNKRTPAMYGVFDSTGKQVGIIIGRSYGYMERPTWEVCRLSEDGNPRLVHSPRTFKAAKAWVAERWLEVVGA